jgi:Rieske Fe-S protein
MVEDTKEKTPSQQFPADAEKKQPPAVVVPVRAPTQVAAASPAPKTPAPSPPSVAAQANPKPGGRRMFIKLLAFFGAVLAIIPFVPWGNYLLGSVSSTGTAKRQLAVLDLNTPTNRNANGSVAGKTVNVKDLTSFPPNTAWLLTYPSSGDPGIDSQNPDTFQKFRLIRLPAELGGSDQAASAFVAYSEVCVHLWCSPFFLAANERFNCPCHGSEYQLPTKDPSTGKLVDAGLAVAGPASLQPAPTNAIPMLTLTADSSGNLYVEPPQWDVDHNGVLGYGRNADSYQNFILPKANGTG